MAEVAAGEYRPLRLLGVLRISKSYIRNGDTSDGISRQREEQISWAERNGAVIVDWAVDPDISAAKTSPFERASLGDWLMWRTDEYDGLLVWKLDRIVRRATDLRELLNYLTKHNKRLISVKEAVIDFDPSSKDHLKRMICDLFMTVVAIIAEMETENTKTRSEVTRGFLRKYGYWPGGRVPYGYTLRPAYLEGAPVKGKVAELQPDMIAVIVRITERLLTRNELGQPVTLSEIAKELTAEGVPTPTQARRAIEGKPTITQAWSGNTVRSVVETRLLVGEFVENGTVIRDDDHMPKQFAPRVFTDAEFATIQAELARRKDGKGSGPAPDPWGVSGVVECIDCGFPLYIHKQDKRHVTYGYYRCATGRSNRKHLPQCGETNRSTSAETLHRLVDLAVRADLAEVELTESVFVPGSGSHEEVSTIKQSIEDLVGDRARGEYNNPFLSELFHQKLRELTARLENLEEKGVTEARWQRVPTGKTLLEEWDNAAWPRRRELVEMAGVTIRHRLGTDLIEVAFTEEALSRLQDYADGKPVRPARSSPLTGTAVELAATHARMLAEHSTPEETRS